MTIKFQSRGPASPATAANKVKGKLTGKEKFTFPDDLPEQYRMVIFAKRYDYNRKSGKTSDIVTTYNLPIPDGIVDNTALQYQDATLGFKGMVGAVAGTAADKLGGATDAKSALNIAGGMIGDVYNTAMGASQTDVKNAAIVGAQVVGNAVGGKLGGQVADMVGAYGGAIPNPNITAFFKGVGLKSYTFNWKFYPRSLKESGIVQNLLFRFRGDSMPGRILGGIGMTYPYEFHMKIVTQGSENVTLFKPAFCTAVNINYAPGGVAFGEDGRPIGYQLALSFKEMDPWSKEDYENVNVSLPGTPNPAIVVPPPPNDPFVPVGEARDIGD